MSEVHWTEVSRADGVHYCSAVFCELRPKSLTDTLHSPAIWVHPPALKTEGHSSPTATDKTCVESAFYVCGKNLLADYTIQIKIL